MMKQQFRIAELISKYLSGLLTEEEQQDLNTWREISPDNEKLFHKLCNSENFKAHYKQTLDFDKTQGWEFLNKKMKTYHRRNIILKISRYAAILILPLIVGIWAWRDASYNNSITGQLENQLVEILPGEKKATLTMDNGEIIDLKNITATFMKEKDGTSILIDSTQLNYQLAENVSQKKEIIYNKIDVPQGGEYTLTLSDGTKVYLNSMTSLRFPVRFTENVREVELNGEGYFEVTPDSKPFIVKYNNVAVEVLGTSFNISAYTGEESHTTLVNGSVKVSLGTGENCVLEPSQQAYIKPGSNLMNVRTVDTSLYTSWIHGKIHFKDERLEDIMDYLAKWYDMTVFYADPSIKNIRFGCNVNRYKDITPFLELLEQTEKVKIVINGKTITFKHN
ncbi:FecR family protein [Bacteroides sp. 519]|uniref:FecR family protein n=1 Tax=Bacteroides sp. 519 TaxID=2302937 RepID=UPI0013D007E9|nr:FecR domain-containing protein [Bacteroides sp. 519]NDV59591.1 FecR family protein [Bacteroides sp. 519]